MDTMRSLEVRNNSFAYIRSEKRLVHNIPLCLVLKSNMSMYQYTKG